ncbi:MAG: hypothetical protein ABI831_21135 [Betaproteobacteria bacterium]
MSHWFQRVVLSRRWATFIVMGAAFAAFGGGTYNLFMVLKANAELLASYGWQALMDGGATQLLELIVTCYLSMAAYTVFKVCEHVLVDHFADAPPAEHRDDEA